MKSKFNSLFIAFVMMSFASVAASPALLSVTASTAASVFNINYKMVEKGTVNISIYDKSNELVFTEVLIDVKSFVRPYNFSELPEGEYTIVVADKNGKQAEKVNYTLSNIFSAISVSEVANEENKYILNVTNNGTENVEVRIYDNLQTLLHVQTVNVTGSFGLIYNLNQVKAVSSTVTFEVTTNSGKVERITF